MKVNELVISLVFLFFFSSCHQKKEFEFNRNIIEGIVSENVKVPSYYNSYLLFSKCNDIRIAIINIEDLRIIYKRKYLKMNFSEFLKNALDQKLDISYKDKIECLEINTEVKAIYEAKPFEYFLTYYCDKVDAKESRIRNSIPKRQLKSVLYYFFINNYLTQLDDKIGYYYIRKTELIYQESPWCRFK